MKKFPNPEAPNSQAQQSNRRHFDQVSQHLERLHITNNIAGDYEQPPIPLYPHSNWTFSDYFSRNRNLAANHQRSTPNPDHVGIIGRVPQTFIESVEKLIFHEDLHKLFARQLRSCDEDQLRLVTYKVTANYEWFINASKHRYGSVSIKNLIEVLAKTPLINSVVVLISNGFWSLMTNQLGFNVISKCLETLSARQNQLIYEAALKNCIQLAKHENGCKSLQKFILNSRNPYKDQLLHLVASYSVCLSQDLSGNYVVQHVLDYQDPVVSDMIFNTLKGHYVRLSKQKAGSFVVQKCLTSGAIDLVVKDFILENNKSFSQLANHPYGNYVIQKALQVSKAASPELYEELSKKVVAFGDLGKSGFARNIAKLLELHQSQQD